MALDVRGRKGKDARRLDEFVRDHRDRIQTRVACARPGCGWEFVSDEETALAEQDAHLAEHGINRRAVYNSAKRRADHERKPKPPAKAKAKKPVTKPKRSGNGSGRPPAPSVVELNGDRWLSTSEASRRLGIGRCALTNRMLRGVHYETRTMFRSRYFLEREIENELRVKEAA